jgi:exosortase/archaeosortase family protein
MNGGSVLADRIGVAWAHIKARSEIRFVLSFVLLSGLFFSVYSFPYPAGSAARHLSDGYLRAYARLAGWALSLFEPGIAVHGDSIAGRYGLRIVRGCDAVDAQILLLSAFLASSAYSWRWRVAGAAGGLVLITVANVVRICSLYYVGAFLPGSFELVHHEIWPLLLIVLAAGIFASWLRLPKERGTPRRGATPGAVP